MAEDGVINSTMHSIVFQPSETQPSETQGHQFTTEDDFFNSTSPTHVLSPASSLDSEDSLIDSDEDASLGVDLALSQEDQIETLKEFLTEAQGVRGDDLVTQKDADTMRGLENMQLAGTSAEAGLASRLELAGRANLEIEKQTASGYFPSETVYLQEHTLKDVLDEASLVLGVSTSSSVAKHSLQVGSASPMKSPRSIDADKALKNELDCLFEERAGRFRLD